MQLIEARAQRARTAVPQSRRSAIRRLALSRFVSLAGTDATGVAIGFALYAQTHSAAILSLSLLVTTGSSALLAPFGGRIGDRVDRRRLMIACELIAATVFLAIALLHTPIALLSLGLLATAIGTVFGPASGAAVAFVAGEDHLTWASGVIATGTNVGKTAGRFFAGALIAELGVTSVFALNVMTFVLSACLIASMRRAVAAPRPGAHDAPAVGEAAHDAAADGAPPTSAPTPRPPRVGPLTLLRGERTLRLLVLSACISTFATAFTMTAEVPLVFAVHAGGLGLGALTACWGLGMVLGSWHAGRALHRGNEATGVLAGRVAMATGVGLVAASPSLAPMLACYLLGGFGGGFMGVAAQSLIMRTTTDAMRAQTLGAIDACRNTAFGIGVIGAGTAVTVAGARPVYAFVGLTMALGAIPIAALVASLGGLRPLRPVRSADAVG
ncbi:MAG TPA: MFS transporter [Conexibacter sp.]